jgi:glycosyltransferase involved in cell wall biosynthesis
VQRSHFGYANAVGRRHIPILNAYPDFLPASPFQIGCALTPSLTIVLPVYNAEQRLAAQVNQLLDVLPELTRRFEILLVDDGSTDDTAHVADELAVCYPQVRLVRHPISLGLAETIQTGLDHTEGEIVLVGDPHHGLPAADLVKLWKLRQENDLVMARKPIPRNASERSVLERLLAWTPSGRRGSARTPEVHVIRRSMLEEIRLDASPQYEPARPNFLAKVKAFAIGE